MDNKRIFFVDDNVVDLNIGNRFLQDLYNVVPVTSGSKLLEMLEKFDADLILLDVKMPEMDGFEVLRKLKENPKTADIPVVFITGQGDTANKQKGLEEGAADYITKPYSKQLLLKRVDNLLQLDNQKKELKEFSEQLKQIMTEKKETIDEMQQAILLWGAELIEFSDSKYNSDVNLIQLYLYVLLREMSKSDLYAEEFSKLNADIEMIVSSSALYDIGKIGLPDNILQKLKKLDNNEYEQIKEHASFGNALIENLKDRLHDKSFLDYAQTMAFLHHEHWDGSGYPLGMKGEEIPLLARAMAVVDAYNALTSKRAYREALSHEEALKVIESGKGIEYDPDIVDIFISISPKFRDINK